MNTRYQVQFTMIGGDQLTHVITTTPGGIRKILYRAQKGRTLLFDNPSGAWLVCCRNAIEIHFKELKE